MHRDEVAGLGKRITVVSTRLEELGYVPRNRLNECVGKVLAVSEHKNPIVLTCVANTFWAHKIVEIDDLSFWGFLGGFLQVGAHVLE